MLLHVGSISSQVAVCTRVAPGCRRMYCCPAAQHSGGFAYCGLGSAAVKCVCPYDGQRQKGKRAFHTGRSPSVEHWYFYFFTPILHLSENPTSVSTCAYRITRKPPKSTRFSRCQRFLSCRRARLCSNSREPTSRNFGGGLINCCRLFWFGSQLLSHSGEDMLLVCMSSLPPPLLIPARSNRSLLLGW